MGFFCFCILSLRQRAPLPWTRSYSLLSSKGRLSQKRYRLIAFKPFPSQFLSVNNKKKSHQMQSKIPTNFTIYSALCFYCEGAHESYRITFGLLCSIANDVFSSFQLRSAEGRSWSPGARRAGGGRHAVVVCCGSEKVGSWELPLSLSDSPSGGV